MFDRGIYRVKPSVSQLRAIGLAVTGFAMWVLSDVGMKLAGDAALPPYETVGLIGFFGVVIMMLKAWRENDIRSLWPHQPRAQLVRASFTLVSIVFNAFALKHLPLTLFYITVFTAPMMIAVVASLFLGERAGWKKILAIILGFAGVMIAIDPLQDAAQGDWIGYGAATCSTLVYVVNIIWLRRMTQSENTNSITFSTAISETAFGLILMLWHAEPVKIALFFILCGAGLVNVIGNFCMFKSIKYAPAATVAPFHYTQIITGGILGYLIWNDVPTMHLIIGAIIIVGSGIYIAAHTQKAENTVAAAPP